MEELRSLQFLEINEKENEMIARVLSRYNIQDYRVLKARSAYKIETKERNLCLKRMKHGEYKAKNGFTFVKDLRKNNFIYTADYLKTEQEEYFVKYKDYIFYLTEWIDGEECNIDNMSDCINCVKLLAKFHIASQSIEVKNYKLRNELKNWPKIFISNLHGLENFKNIISKKRLVTEFDSLYLQYIDNLYHRGMVAIDILNKSNYYKLSREALSNRTICHDSFYYQNIIKKGEEYYIIDLDSIIIDLQINDLGKFIRRLMYKKEFKWDFDKAKLMIEAYNEVKPVSIEELEVMLALIMFPHKFWKLGRKRYIKHKHWPETKYMRKINKIIKYNDLQDIFLDKYIRYISSME